MISNYPNIQFNNSKPVQILYKLNYDNQYDINSIKKAKSYNVDDISKISLKNNNNIITQKEEVASSISSLDYINHQNLNNNNNNNIGTEPYFNVYSINSIYSNKTNNISLYDPVKDPTSSPIRSSITIHI